MKTRDVITLFLCGDVMTGRGIDQVLPHPSDPMLYESYVKDARGYVRIAEKANGPISKPVSYSYIWGDALDELERVAPDVRIVNLETSVTTSDDYWRAKGINYRMHPKNVPCLTAAHIDLCVLANNHVLDWGYPGLIDTLETLQQAGLKTAGAGRDLTEAEAPAILEIGEKRRVIVFSFGSPTSGVLPSWAASEDRPGVNLLHDFSADSVRAIGEKVSEVNRQGDIVVLSIHWGGNWGYRIPAGEIEFAHSLIDNAGIDLIHGHSSHHVKGIEVYKGKPILYGCGDFLNDYEGIGGYEEFRGDLSLMYFVSMDPSNGRLAGLEMTPTQTRNFRVHRASSLDAQWLRNTLNREGAAFGTLLDVTEDDRLRIEVESIADSC